MRALAACVLAGALAVAAAGAAVSPGLVQAPSAVLAGMSERGTVRTSPDGRHAYFLGGYDERTGIAIVARDPPTGALSRRAGPDGCLVTWIDRRTHCRRAPAFNNSRALAVAPTGDVAVGGRSVRQIAVFRPTRGGGLTLASCLGDHSGGYPCASLRGLGGVRDLAFSPDGRNLYVASWWLDPGLLILGRAAGHGVLHELAGDAGCIQRRGRTAPETPPCAAVPAGTFAPALVRVTPDGRDVVVVSDGARDDGVFVFARDARSGALALLSCYTTSARPPCSAALAPTPADLAIAPDGETLVAVSATYDAGSGVGFGRLDVLHLDPASGQLDRMTCWSTHGTACTRTTVPAGPESLALAVDGRAVYVGGRFALRAYRLVGGVLKATAGPTGCVSVLRAAGCAVTKPPRFDGFSSLAATRDGRMLFAAGEAGFAFRARS